MTLWGGKMERSFTDDEIQVWPSLRDFTSFSLRDVKKAFETFPGLLFFLPTMSFVFEFFFQEKTFSILRWRAQWSIVFSQISPPPPF